MSQKKPIKPTVKPIRSRIKPVFHLQDKKEVDNVLSEGLIKSAKRTGQLNLSNKGLGTVPEKLWQIDELVLDEFKVVDFNKSDGNQWWYFKPMNLLDLSSNAISVLPPNIKLLSHLVTLKLHDNCITCLPKEIEELTELNNLSLDYNKLVKLPKAFYKLTDLRWLSISHNLLEQIDPDFGDLVMLTFLDLSHNKLTVLPPGMGYLVRIVELNLSHNELQELPPDIVNLRDLKIFNVSSNNLKQLPAMGELRKMEMFSANYNNIEMLPDFLGCTALKEIHIAHNFIVEITEEFCDQMQHLAVLNIRDNKLVKLPDNISLLKTLKRLDLTNNNLNVLPTNLGMLTQLHSLNMEGNELPALRQDVIRGGSNRVIKFLRDRITDENEETKCPENEWPDKFTIKKIQALMVPNKDLTSIPDSVFKVAAEVEAHIVDLSKNKLTVVPSGVFLLEKTLSQLMLASNQISEVPPEIGRCSHLQFLDLSKNCLTDLPPQLAELKNLRELVICNNKMDKIPRPIYQLENLEILLAAGNKVEEINVSSDALSRLTRLAVLDLSNNSIASVPPELGNFAHLRSLELMGNCFRQPRHAILEKGTASILSYLRDRIPAK